MAIRSIKVSPTLTNAGVAYAAGDQVGEEVSLPDTFKREADLIQLRHIRVVSTSTIAPDLDFHFFREDPALGVGDNGALPAVPTGLAAAKIPGYLGTAQVAAGDYSGIASVRVADKEFTQNIKGDDVAGRGLTLYVVIETQTILTYAADGDLEVHFSFENNE